MNVKSFFKKIFSPSSTTTFLKYVSVVYPIVEIVAIATPSKVDDEILSLARQWGVRAILDGSKPKGEVLKDVAVKIARQKLPDVPKEILARAVEAAYQQMKASRALH